MLLECRGGWTACTFWFFFDFLEVLNELGKVTKFGTSRPLFLMEKWTVEKSVGWFSPSCPWCSLLGPICFLSSLLETIWLIFVATILMWSEASCWDVKWCQFLDLWLVTGHLTKNLIRFCGQQKTTDVRVVSSVC